MVPCRKYQKVEKQDTDGSPYHNDAMTSAHNVIQELVHWSWHRYDEVILQHLVSQLFGAS